MIRSSAHWKSIADVLVSPAREIHGVWHHLAIKEGSFVSRPCNSKELAEKLTEDTRSELARKLETKAASR